MIVRAVNGHRVELLNAPLDCRACANGTGCGAALLSARRRSTFIDWHQGPPPNPGDRLVPVRKRAVLRAASMGYGLPLAGFVTGASLGHWFGTDAIAALTGLIGGVLAVLVSRRFTGAAPEHWRVLAADSV